MIIRSVGDVQVGVDLVQELAAGGAAGRRYTLDTWRRWCDQADRVERL